MKSRILQILMAYTACVLSVVAQTPPGAPEDNGLIPKSDTIYINVPPVSPNNGNTESLGVAIGQNGNVLVGWEDDGDGFFDTESIWTMFNSSGVSITPDTPQSSLDPAYAGQSVTNRFLSYFRKDGSATPGISSWGPKIKANPFSDGFGMGATSYGLGTEVPEFAAIQTQADGSEGDFPSVQLLTKDGQSVGIVAGVDDAYADRDGDIRIGDWEYLSNGNIVIVGESRQDQDLIDVYGGSAPGHQAIYRIVGPTGNVVKAVSLVSATPDPVQIWHGVGVTSNGFAVRFDLAGAQVRMFDNSGNPTSANIDLAALTGHLIAGGGGRGDGTGFHGNGKDAYVAVSAGTDDQGNKAVWVTVLNASGTLRYSTNATAGMTLVGPGRVDAAIDANGRVLAVFADADASGTGAYSYLIGGRLLDATGTPTASPFYVSEAELPSNSLLLLQNPRVAWRGDLAAIVWESKNNPATPDRVVAMRLFNTSVVGVPALTATRSGSELILSWPTSATGFTLESTGALPASSWTTVGGVVNNSVTNTIGPGNKFYRLRK
ncbi:MAG: hypothetical protein DME23_20220 [Verrucomicrobia bacterium]|nr:MAG: hypothetical protein DME23_20220 [Verrucomicrobiota bacterium]